jgi:3-hydroxymyristoyl/3-hydroxydecanoyl-(acyl carrier protein) dehydratase
MKFRMVDRILDWEARKSIRGSKTVSFEEYQLKATFGEEPRLPECLIMESLLQLGNWLIMLSSDFSQMGLVIRTQEIAFTDSLRPGEHLEMEVRVRSYRSDGIVFDGRAMSQDRLIAAGQGCLAAPVELRDYYNPEDLRVLFSEIYRPRNRDTGKSEL